MRRMTNVQFARVLLPSFLFCVAVSSVRAQDADAVTAVAAKATALRSTPSLSSQARALAPGERLTVLKGEKSGAFIYASLTNGVEGWVPESDVSIRSWSNAKLALGVNPAPPKACPTTLAACPDQGCTADPTHHIDPGLNRVKNRAVKKTGAASISWADLVTLQTFVDNTLKLATGFGTALTPAQRAALRQIPTKSGPLSEGDMVSLDGFISLPAGNTANPHAGGGESCNCGLSSAANVDFHVNIAPGANDDEFHGIVAEVTPRHRLAQFPLASITQLQTQRKRVRITGQLLLDNAHKIRRTPEENKFGNPPRFSIWELHPITSIHALP